jgi:hypothetical protein
MIKLKIYNELLRIIIRLEPPLCVVSSWVIKRFYTVLISNTISGSSNLDNYFFHCLMLTLISHLKVLFNSLFYYIIYIICNLYSWPLCGSTPVLSGYLLLWHSCTWDKTSTLWSCQQRITILLQTIQLWEQIINSLQNTQFGSKC